MHPLIRKANNIPLSIRPDVVDVIDRTRNQFQFNQPDIAYIFEVYNRYIAPKNEPENIDCGGCRTKVVGKMRELVTMWKENEQSAAV